MNKPTQNSRLLGHLKQGNSITTMTAFTDFGVTKISNRMGEIEKETGEKIERKRIKVKTRYGGEVSVVEYSLVIPEK